MDDRVDAGDGLGDGRAISQWRPDERMRNAAEIRQPADRQVVENPDPIATLNKQPNER